MAGKAKFLAIGNSYTSHGTADDVWWASGIGMAASVDSTQYTQQIANAAKAEITKGNYVNFEINYSPEYDFEKNIPIDSNDYDLVIVQLFENAAYKDSMTESWESLYDYIKSKCSNAVIVQLVGWYEESKYKAISKAANNKGVTILDCSDVTGIGKNELNDYTTGDDGNYHKIVNSGVAAHPSDIGFYHIAKKY